MVEQGSRVSVELTEEDAALFMLYQQYHRNMTTLLTAKALDIRDGAVVLHFDHDGNIRKIDRHDSLFTS